MTQHEELQEKYIDAYFALLMEEVAVEEGRRLELENETLRQNPDVAVPEELSRRCLKTIEHYFALQRRQRTLQMLKKVMYRVAVLAMVVSTLFTTAYAFSENFRMIIGQFDTHARLRLEGTSIIKNTAISYDIAVEWLPDGYIFTEESRSSQSVWKQYTASAGQLIEVSVYTDPNITINLDSENAEIKSLKIQSNSALIIKKEGDIQITWVDSKAGVLWEVFGTGTSQSDVIRVAEHVILE